MVTGQLAQGQFAHGKFAQKNGKIKLKNGIYIGIPFMCKHVHSEVFLY